MRLAMICASDDIPYLGALKPFLGTSSGHQTTIVQTCPEYILPLKKDYDGVICSQEAFLNKIVDKSRHVLIHDYAGSFFTRAGDLPIIIINPLKQIYSLPEGEFLLRRYLSKILTPDAWQRPIPFRWEEVTNDTRLAELHSFASSPDCIAISIDIETQNEPVPAITICSYSIIFESTPGKIRLINFTFAIDSLSRVRWMRLFNDLPAPKIFQNGNYDNSWFLRYGVPCRNWCFDTMDMFHSWYSELPKRLDFVTSFCVRESWFWKNDGKTGKWSDYCEYGCRDVWATSLSWLYMMETLPAWAWDNYKDKFPINYPSILCGVRGWKIDEIRREEIKSEKIPEIEAARKILTDAVRNPDFNPGSPKQVTALLNVISKRKLVASSNEATIQIIRAEHPLNELLCSAITEYREASKLVSTYLKAKLIHGRFLYSLSPSGTDTGRLASRGSFLWSGGNIQNIPRGSVIKSCYVADDGYYLAEPDAEQAEARCVAYLSGDENLIATVESGKDYHAMNAEKFFGVPYDQIVSPDGAVLDDELRDLSKRVNHGANYNMAEAMLLVTMGAANVIKAQRLLKLPRNWKLIQVCAHLLKNYSEAYPLVKGEWYQSLIATIRATRIYVSPLGHSRYFFGAPWKNKPDLNQLVAHAAQNLNVAIINESFRDLFQFERKNNGNFKLLAQIHDSIPFQYRIGRLDLAQEAAQIMRRRTKITDPSGKSRWMEIPIALKAEGARWSELKKIKSVSVVK